MKRTTDATKIIGQNLKDIREIYGFSQSHIGLQIDKTFQQVQKYENGINRLPSETLYLLKQFYGIPYDCFFKGMDDHVDHTIQSQVNIDDIFLLALRNIQNESVKQKVFDLLEALAGRID